MTTVRRNGRAFLKALALVGVVAIIGVLLLFSGGQPAHAATITVNSTADVVADDGACSLREAITAANTDTASGATAGECPAGSGADSISVPAGTYTLSIAGAGEDANATGDLDITADLTINGAGAATTIVDGNALDRVFHVGSGIVTIWGVTMQNGSSGEGGGLVNHGTLTLNNSSVSGNATGSLGGGIVNANGVLALNNTTVSGNVTVGAGGGIYSFGPLTITGGSVNGNTAASDVGGGIANFSTLTLSNVTISGNSAPGPLGGAGGGGMYNAGILTLNGSTVSGNTASGGNGGGGILNVGTLTGNSSTVNANTASAAGGGISNLHTVTLTNSTVSGNTAGGAAGILNDGTMTLNSSIVSGNTASGGCCAGGSGGGIQNNATLNLNSSSVSGNSAMGGGGGILNHGTTFGAILGGSLALNGSTVSGNTANGGGGIFNDGLLAVTNSTVSGNMAVDGGGILTQGNPVFSNTNLISNTISGNAASGSGGGIFNAGSPCTPSPCTPLTLENTIVANSPAGGDCSGTITSAGHNLDSDNTCSLIGAGDIPGVDPLLGPLANNGGPTQTHALLPGSPAIDAASPDCPPPATDQRGVARPQGAACDIGAFERVLVITVQIDIKPGSDPNSINAGSEGVIPVAILTTASFDAATVNALSVKLEGAPVRLKGKSGNAGSLEDVDGDGDLDLVVQIIDWALSPGSTTATLTGQTFSGTAIQGSDSVNVVP